MEIDEKVILRGEGIRHRNYLFCEVVLRSYYKFSCKKKSKTVILIAKLFEDLVKIKNYRVAG